MTSLFAIVLMAGEVAGYFISCYFVARPSDKKAEPAQPKQEEKPKRKLLKMEDFESAV